MPFFHMAFYSLPLFYMPCSIGSTCTSSKQKSDNANTINLKSSIKRAFEQDLYTAGPFKSHVLQQEYNNVKQIKHMRFDLRASPTPTAVHEIDLKDI